MKFRCFVDDNIENLNKKWIKMKLNFGQAKQCMTANKLNTTKERKVMQSNTF